MTAEASPGIYLATPRAFSATDLCAALEPILGRFDIACLRIEAAASDDEKSLLHSAGLIAAVARGHDVPVVVESHYRVAKSLGLDGVHLPDGPRHARDARKALGPDAIVGAYCGTSRHAGITAAEIGCDYISFGPVGATGLLGDGVKAGADLFEWWAQMIEIPVVAEGGLTPSLAASIGRSADFLCLGPEIWTHPEGAEFALNEFLTELT